MPLPGHAPRYVCNDQEFVEILAIGPRAAEFVEDSAEWFYGLAPRTWGIKADGSLWAWGKGPLGDGLINSWNQPCLVDAGPWTNLHAYFQDVPDQIGLRRQYAIAHKNDNVYVLSPNYKLERGFWTWLNTTVESLGIVKSGASVPLPPVGLTFNVANHVRGVPSGDMPAGTYSALCGVSRISVLDGGSGYTSAPNVTLSGSHQISSATARAIIDGGAVVAIVVDNAGQYLWSAGESEEDVAPSVVITGGGGSSASAVASLATSGRLHEVVLTNAGDAQDYYEEPTVSINANTEIVRAALVAAPVAGWQFDGLPPYVDPFSDRGSSASTPLEDYYRPLSASDTFRRAPLAARLVFPEDNPGVVAPALWNDAAWAWGGRRLPDWIPDEEGMPVYAGENVPPVYYPQHLSYTLSSGAIVQRFDNVYPAADPTEPYPHQLRGAVGYLTANVDDKGAGYTEPAVAVVVAQHGLTPTLESSAVTGKVYAIGVLSGGSGYTEPPAVSIAGNATAIAHISGPVRSVTITNGGSGYTMPPRVVFSEPGNPAVAAATIRDGVVVAVTLKRGGTYRSAPTVSFVSVDGTGSGAAATCEWSGAVLYVDVTDQGSGYTSTPTVSVEGNAELRAVVLYDFQPPTLIAGGLAPNDGGVSISAVSACQGLVLRSDGFLKADAYSPITVRVNGEWNYGEIPYSKVWDENGPLTDEATGNKYRYDPDLSSPPDSPDVTITTNTDTEDGEYAAEPILPLEITSEGISVDPTIDPWYWHLAIQGGNFVPFSYGGRYRVLPTVTIDTDGSGTLDVTFTDEETSTPYRRITDTTGHAYSEGFSEKLGSPYVQHCVTGQTYAVATTTLKVVGYAFSKHRWQEIKDFGWSLGGVVFSGSFVEPTEGEPNLLVDESGSPEIVQLNESSVFSGRRWSDPIVFRLCDETGTGVTATSALNEHGEIIGWEWQSWGSSDYTTNAVRQFDLPPEYRPASATAIIEDGKITSVDVTDPGAWTQEPSVRVTSTTGSGARVNAVMYREVLDVPAAVEDGAEVLFLGGDPIEPATVTASGGVLVWASRGKYLGTPQVVVRHANGTQDVHMPPMTRYQLLGIDVSAQGSGYEDAEITITPREQPTTLIQPLSIATPEGWTPEYMQPNGSRFSIATEGSGVLAYPGAGEWTSIAGRENYYGHIHCFFGLYSDGFLADVRLYNNALISEPNVPYRCDPLFSENTIFKTPAQSLSIYGACDAEAAAQIQHVAYTYVADTVSPEVWSTAYGVAANVVAVRNEGA